MSRELNAALSMRDGLSIPAAARKHRVKRGVLHYHVVQKFAGISTLRKMSDEEIISIYDGPPVKTRNCMCCKVEFSDHPNIRMCEKCRDRASDYHDGYV